jgi:hypothetical protein
LGGHACGRRYPLNRISWFRKYFYDPVAIFGNFARNSTMLNDCTGKQTVKFTPHLCFVYPQLRALFKLLVNCPEHTVSHDGAANP